MESEVSSKQRTFGKVFPKMVLLVDDDPDQLFLFKHVFEADGWRVVSANSAAEAEGLLKDIHVDAVVSDINMPQVTGIKLIEKLRKASDLVHLPFVAITADHNYQAEELMEAGADGFCYKDQARNLVDCVESVLSNQKKSGSLLGQIRERFEQ